MEDEPTVDYITRFIAKTQQEYTQKGGVRPFGISTLIMGFGDDKKPKLYQTEPSGSYSLWKASAIGRNSKSVREFLEKSYQEEMDFDTSVKLAVESLMEVVESEKNIEVSYMNADKKTKFLTDLEVEKIIEEVKKKNENK
jgi:20S proteasome subunit alpha 4